MNEDTTKQEGNKIIAKNTIFLYLRMFFTLGVSLYTSRVVLEALGVEDFGIYSVVGSIVLMLSFLNTSMSSATARFITFEIGKKGKVQKVFSASVLTHIIIAFLILVIGWVLGKFVIFEQLDIPLSRVIAAQWVYYFSLLSASVAVLQVPYSAMVISYERFNIFAYVEIWNSILKLIVVYLLFNLDEDKLVIYGCLVFIVSIIIFFTYFIYARSSFKDCSLDFNLDFSLIKEMFSFSGWDLYGNLSVVARMQGVNILFNVFFGALINAANGVAISVQSAVMAFANSAVIAVKPQIVKSYASGDYVRTNELVLNAAKFTFILLLLVTLPLIFEMKYVLALWLVNVPESAVSFCQYILVFNFFANTSFVIVSAIHATGNVKRPSLINGTLYLLVVPLSYIAFRMGGGPIVSFQINIVMVMLGMFSNAWTLNIYLPQFSIKTFIVKMLIPCVFILMFSTVVVFMVVSTFEQGFIRLVITITLSSTVILGLSYLFALDRNQKKWVFDALLNKFNKRSKCL